MGTQASRAAEARVWASERLRRRAKRRTPNTNAWTTSATIRTPQHTLWTPGEMRVALRTRRHIRERPTIARPHTRKAPSTFAHEFRGFITRGVGAEGLFKTKHISRCHNVLRGVVSLFLPLAAG